MLASRWLVQALQVPLALQVILATGRDRQARHCSPPFHRHGTVHMSDCAVTGAVMPFTVLPIVRAWCLSEAFILLWPRIAGFCPPLLRQPSVRSGDTICAAAEPAHSAECGRGKRIRSSVAVSERQSRGGGTADAAAAAAAASAPGDADAKDGGADGNGKNESVVEKRLKQNREAARRSRERKRLLKEDLQRRLPELQAQHDAMVAEVDELMSSVWVRRLPGRRWCMPAPPLRCKCA